MRRKPASRRTRLAVIGIDVCGAGAAVYGVSLWSVPVAFVLAGLLAMLAALLLEGGELL